MSAKKMVLTVLAVNVVLLLVGTAVGANFAANRAERVAAIAHQEIDDGYAQIADELRAQNIRFPQEANLKPVERAVPGVVENAGQLVLTGAQAKAYAGFIGVHTLDYGKGKTYSEMGDVQKQLRADIAQAQNAGDQDAVANLNKELTSVNSARETVFKGETLKGLLGIPYAMSELIARGERHLPVAHDVANTARNVRDLALWGLALYVVVGIGAFVVNRRRRQQQLDHELEELENEVRVAA